MRESLQYRDDQTVNFFVVGKLECLVLKKMR